MSRLRLPFGLVLAGLLARPVLAGADEVYSYQDSDGVLHFSNAPSDARFHKVNRSGGSSIYRKAAPQARARPLAGGPAAVEPASYGRADKFREHVRAAAQKYKLPENLLLAVMSVESNCDHRALSEKGAMGLMQLMPGTARDMYVANAWDPLQNIEGGARYLRILANQYNGDPVQVLAAYNAGPDAVRRSGGAVPNIPETREYVRKVVELWKAYEAGR
ncbi:MAG TPA: transglycosylase SLT domain-containing protein [Anaeromyxobacter sp.]